MVTKRWCHGVVGATVASVVFGVLDGRAGGVDGVRTAGGGVIAVVAASATRRSGVIAALLLRAGGGVLLRGLAPELLDDFCMLQQLNAATQNKSRLWACVLSLSKQHRWHESYALQALINALISTTDEYRRQILQLKLAWCKTLGSFLVNNFHIDEAISGKLRHPLPFLKQ